MLIVLLRGMVKIRVGFETEYGAKYSHMCVGQYIWHTIQAHQIMGEFKAASFHKLPHISLIIANHLFKQVIHKAEVNILKGGINELREELNNFPRRRISSISWWITLNTR